MPVMAQWTQLEIDAAEGVFWSSDDVASCFYVFSLPKGWRPYMVVNKKAWIHGAWTWISLRVVPMGWASAVAFVQHMHQELMRVTAGLPQRERLRGDRAAAHTSNGRLRRFYQLYVDNIDQAEVAVLDEVVKLTTHWSEAIEMAGDVSGVPYTPDKRERHVLRCESLGAEIVGDLGVLRPSRKRLSRIWCLAHRVLGGEHVSFKELRVLLGMLVYVLQYRRPANRLLWHVWTSVGKWSHRRICLAVIITWLLWSCCVL
eukprot:6477107-Amphidinium_carterae.1